MHMSYFWAPCDLRYHVLAMLQLVAVDGQIKGKFFCLLCSFVFLYKCEIELIISNLVVQDGVDRSFMCKDEESFIKNWLCNLQYCGRCIMGLLGESTIDDLLEDCEWSYFEFNVNLTTNRRKTMELFFTLIATNGLNIQYNHKTDNTCFWL